MKQVENQIKILFIGIFSILSISMGNAQMGIAQKKYSFEYNLIKGETYRQHAEIDMKISQEFMGTAMDITSKIGMYMSYKVVDVKNNLYNIQWSYTRVKMETVAGGMMMSFDSDKNSAESSNPLSEMNGILKSFVNIPINIEMDKKGKTISVKGIEKLQESLNKAIESSSNPQIKFFAASFNNQISEESIRASLEQSSNVYPKNPVAVGESWDINTKINSNGIAMMQKMKITLKQVEGDVAILEGTGTIGTDGSITQNIQGQEARITYNGEQTQVMKISLKSGWVITGELNQNLKGKTEIGGNSIPMTTVSKTTITSE